MTGLMNDLKIKRSSTSLEVSLEASTGKLLFTGRSIPENSPAFFQSVIQWLEEYSKNPAPKTECTCKIEYFNSASRKCLVDVFMLLDSIYRSSNDVTVIWNYDEDDDNMKETGEDYKAMFKMPFKVKPD